MSRGKRARSNQKQGVTAAHGLATPVKSISPIELVHFRALGSNNKYIQEAREVLYSAAAEAALSPTPHDIHRPLILFTIHYPRPAFIAWFGPAHIVHYSLPKTRVQLFIAWFEHHANRVFAL
ncbi:hypothetical protein EVAR_14745_1 [Eumeta japonica]|uniref:Uncharacterized protein n=1 Tax=Eumeta variegata TaxID=151549 RepID=A0A4C1TWF1_EUMVA|nr:hypothetical protein EVAR_14745_1 [Eumeta japonica]